MPYILIKESTRSSLERKKKQIYKVLFSQHDEDQMVTTDP
jgi:hypothetical protein